MPTPVRAAVVAALSTTLLLAACGGSGENSSSSGAAAASQVEGLSAEQVVEKAEAAVRNAKSVHYVVKGTDDGKALVIDMRVAKDRGAVGEITGGDEQLKLIRTGDAVYVTGNEALLAAASGGKPVTAGKWVKTSATAPGISGFTDLADPGKIMDQLVKPGQKLSIGTAKTVAGKQTVAVVIGPDANGGNGGTMYVSAQGTPYPLLVETAAGAKDQGTVTFSDFDAPVDIAEPAATDVVAAPTP